MKKISIVLLFAFIAQIFCQLPTEIDPAAFQQTAQFGKVKAFWTIDEAAGTITIGLQASTTGWLAFGVSPSGFMTPNCDVTFGFVDGNGAVAVVDGHIGDNRDQNCGNSGVCQDVDPALGGANNIDEFNGNSNGQLSMIFKRKLDTGDGKGDIAITNEDLNIIWALGPTAPNFPTIVPHNFDGNGNSYGQAKVNFFTGAVSVVDVDGYRKAHGALMFLGWAIIIPVTSFVARWWKQFGWWFNVHRISNAVAMFGFCLVAFILAIIMTGTHFSTPHKVIGLIVTIFGTLNPVLGFVADKMFNPNRTKAPVFPDKIHWLIGWGTLALAAVNIALGIIEYQAVTGILVAYIATIGIIAAFMLAFFVIHCSTGWPKGH